MSRSFLAAIRNAVVSAPEVVSPEGEEAGALAPDSNARSGQTQENAMSDDPNKPGATNASGITQTTYDAAVASARSEGEATGAKAATNRLTAALGAEGVKGDAGRMAAALDLAVKSPGMSGEDVAAFVTANVTGQQSVDATAQGYDASRLASAGQAQPVAKPGNAAKGAASWAAFRGKRNPVG